MANYLIHHGIKGQQWGVQNGPPYPLDSKVKAEAYRTREKEKVEKKYSVSKSSKKKIARLENKKNTEGLSDKQAIKLDKALKRVEFGKKMAEKELKALDKMSVEELLIEKNRANVQTGKDWVTSAVITASSALFLPITFITVPGYNVAGDTVNTSALKTANRVSEKDMKDLMRKYGQDRNYA